jgi:hypothetical protein
MSAFRQHHSVIFASLCAILGFAHNGLSTQLPKSNCNMSYGRRCPEGGKREDRFFDAIFQVFVQAFSRDGVPFLNAESRVDL